MAATIDQTKPSHIESAQGDVFVLGSTLLQDNPQLLSTYFKQSGYPPTTLSKLKIFGMGTPVEKAIEGPIVGHYEKARPKDIFTVGTIENVDGNQITISLSVDDMYTSDNTSTIGTQIFSRPRVTEVYQFAITGTQYRIIAKDRTVNPHQITLEANGNVDPTDDIVEGAVASMITTISGEGTGQPEPLRPIRFKYVNTFAIIKETDITSGTHLTTSAPFQTVPGTNLIWKEGFRDAEMRMEQMKGHTWMFGQKAEGWTDYSDPLKSDVPIPGTQGLLSYALENGLDFEYSASDFDDSDLYELSNYYHDIRVSSDEILLIEGYNFNQKIEKFFSSRYNYNWVIGVSDRYIAEGVRNARNYDPNGFTEEGMMINLGITGFSLGNYTFLQTSAPELDYIGGAGLIGGKDWAIGVPFGFAGENAEYRPYVGYQWRGTPGYSRENELWMNGGAGNSRVVKSSEFDVQNTYMRSEIAPHFALGEQFIVIHPEGTSAS